MLDNSVSRAPWSNLGYIGQLWRLIERREPTPGTLEEYIGFWQTRFKMFTDLSTEEKREECRQQYLRDCERSLRWNGLCKLGEDMQVVRCDEPEFVILSRDWKGTIQDKAELVIELLEEKTVFRKHVRYLCHISRYAKVPLEAGSPDEYFSGLRPGKYWTRTYLGFGDDPKMPVSFSPAEGIVTIRDARFKIIK